MTVSLLAYTPKFDVDAEEWYVDINFVLDKAPDPFVRFGLVRFQPHAPKYLQVSAPIVEWVQPLPERKLTVYLNPHSANLLNIEVTGLATTEAQIDPSLGGTNNSELQVPQMKIALYAETDSEFGLMRYQVSEAKNIVISGENSITSWKTSLSLDQEDFPEGAKIYVQVKEIEKRPKATFKVEPINLSNGLKADSTTIQESGPRLIARVEVPQIWVKDLVVRRDQ